MSNINGEFKGFLNGILQLVNYATTDPNIILNKAPITLIFTKVASERYSIVGQISLNLEGNNISIVKLSGVAQYDSHHNALNVKFQGSTIIFEYPIPLILTGSINLKNQYCMNKLSGNLDFLAIPTGEQAGLIGESVFSIRKEID